MKTLLFICLSILSKGFLSLCKRNPKLYKVLQKKKFIKDCINETPCSGFIDNRILKVNVDLHYMGLSPTIKTNVYLLLFCRQKDFFASSLLNRTNNSNDPKWSNPILLKRNETSTICLTYILPDDLNINNTDVLIKLEYKNLIGEYISATAIIGTLNENECGRTITLLLTPHNLEGSIVFWQMKK